jgi:hypothetical protein
MTRLDKDLAALATMSPAQLREKWSAVGEGPAPAVPTNLLRQLLAHKLQERRHGRLSPLVARELERVLIGATPAEIRQQPTLTPGTRLIREWNGRTIAVEVREDGFAWEDRPYRSLSQIARDVTGAHWSGPRFFGLHRHG